MAGSWLPRQDVIVDGETLPTPEAFEFLDSDFLVWEIAYDEATGTVRITGSAAGDGGLAPGTATGQLLRWVDEAWDPASDISLPGDDHRVIDLVPPAAGSGAAGKSLLMRGQAGAAADDSTPGGAGGVGACRGGDGGDGTMAQAAGAGGPAYCLGGSAGNELVGGADGGPAIVDGGPGSGEGTGGPVQIGTTYAPVIESGSGTTPWEHAGDHRVAGETSIESGSSWTGSEEFETTDATPIDVQVVAAVPTGKHGHYDVSVWASGVVATTGASVCLARRSLFSVNDDGSVETRVADDVLGSQYDGITVGGLSVEEDGGTPAALRALITGKAATTIKWSVKVDVLRHLVAHEIGS